MSEATILASGGSRLSLEDASPVKGLPIPCGLPFLTLPGPIVLASHPRSHMLLLQSHAHSRSCDAAQHGVPAA